jgi:hypothetical protein
MSTIVALVHLLGLFSVIILGSFMMLAPVLGSVPPYDTARWIAVAILVLLALISNTDGLFYRMDQANRKYRL